MVIFAFLVVLAVIVLVHETGHYLAARVCGVGVRTFSLGIGPTVLKVCLGGTDFCISAIPLGGYVKLNGTNALDLHAGETRAPTDFLAKGRGTRAFVYAAGPAASVLLGIALHTVALWQGMPLSDWSESSTIASVRAGSRAAADGFRAGDVIDAAAGFCTDDWLALRAAIVYVEYPVEIDVRRGPGLASVVATLPASRDLEEYGLVMQPPSVASIQMAREEAEGPATKADGALPSGDGRIGFGAAVAESARLSWTATTQTGAFIGDTLRGRAPEGGLMGIIGIGWLTGRVVERLGWAGLVDLTAMLSLAIGLFNLLPVVPLDGGHLAVLGIEGVRRRDFGDRVRFVLLLAGVALILGLFVVTVVLDVRMIAAMR